MSINKLYGYMGKILRVNLSTGSITDEPLETEIVEKYIGGTGFGAEYLYREVLPGTDWDDPENRIIFASGPFSGTKVPGSGTFSVVTKGSMTNLAVSTQANGYFGAYLKLAGYDAIIIQGTSPKWVYLFVGEGNVELRDARSLLGKNMLEVEDVIKNEHDGKKKISVFGIGPAGENLVRFSVITGDKGHVASKNGCGCVMGSKRLKAIAIPRLNGNVPVYDSKLLNETSRKLGRAAKEAGGGMIHKWGTGFAFSKYAETGMLPTRNLTTNLFPEHEKMNAQYIRTHFEHRSVPCWRCGVAHVKHIKVTEGPYKGFEGEEPEYESMAAWGPVIGNTDPGAVVMLSNVCDQLGLDTNEAGWTIGWVLECYEKGIFTRDDLDGLEMNWGNVEAVHEMLKKISRREGIGDLLAEGVKQASEKIGGKAAEMGVFVLKGATPRGHDHRAAWYELMDTCISSTGTIQSAARLLNPEIFGIPPVNDQFSPWEVAGSCAKLDGWWVFIDCLGVCRFITRDFDYGLDCLNAVTGMGFDRSDAMTIGRRIISQLRAFNLLHGLDPSLEVPSARYGSTPVNGPAKGKSIMPYFQWMKSFYFELNGWDSATGKPLPHTLESLGLGKIIPDLYPK